MNQIELIGRVTMAPTKLKAKEGDFINMTVKTVFKLAGNTLVM